MGIFSRKREQNDTEQNNTARSTEAASGGEDSGTWIYDVDGEHASELFIPPEAIIRAVKVDEHGNETGEYIENENYGTPKDDFDRLAETDGDLAWIGDDLPGEVRGALEMSLMREEPGFGLGWVKVIGAPHVVMAEPSAGAPTRASSPGPWYGVTIPVAFKALHPGQHTNVLTGVLNMIASGRHEDRLIGATLNVDMEQDAADAELVADLQEMADQME